MRISSQSFDDGSPMPAEFAFAKPDPETKATLSSNRNPHLSWGDVPDGAKSFALICVDPDAPTVGDDVNKEGRAVAADLARADFHHWVMVDIPTTCTEIAAGSCSDGVQAGGKSNPDGPEGSRQGLNDFGGWFAGDPEMQGKYFGYDGPGPPWNDERVHRYRFQLFALDLDRCAVEGEFTVADVRAAIEGHVLAEATVTGTYTLNPDLLP